MGGGRVREGWVQFKIRAGESTLIPREGPESFLRGIRRDYSANYSANYRVNYGLNSSVHYTVKYVTTYGINDSVLLTANYSELNINRQL